MCRKSKRVNFDRHQDDKQVSNGVLNAGVDLSTSADGLSITPINERGKQIDSRRILVPLANLDEFAQSVQALLEEVENEAGRS